MADFYVRVTEDNLQVVAGCEVPPGDLGILVKRIQRELGPLGLGKYFKPGHLEVWLRKAAEEHGTILRNEVLIQGQALEEPVNGRIEWAKDFFTTEFYLDEESGAIDYRQRMAQTTVADGDLLAHLVKAEKGRDGRDVYGRVLKVAHPIYARIKASSNVRYDDDTSNFYAASQGRIRWANDGLSVDPVYHIAGNLGLETGDVDHPGAVVVDGDVEQGAVLKADGDVEVKGVVQGRVVTGGSLTVRGGISGSEGMRIEVQGSVQAKFILETQIDVEGDVVVEKEIIHSQVRCRGNVKMPVGRLVGGSVIALGSVTIGQIGSDALTPTEVTAGDDYRLPIETAILEEKILKMEGNRERTSAMVTPLKDTLKDLPPDKLEAAKALLSNIPKINKTLDELRARIVALRTEARQRGVCRMLVSKGIYAESVLCLGKEVLRVREDRLGPSRILLANGRVAILPA